jgi:lipopolysaccharide transport system ATP-binding protein
MSDTVIQVEKLSKRYRIGLKEEQQHTLVGAITATLSRPLKNLQRLRKLSRFQESGDETEDVIWALKDISFEVKRGEIIGIIGKNGSGKSTLLKILSRITEPTSGYAKIRGRVSSLLEVGTGFNLELTGRENVYMNGTMLGMRKAEIDQKFDEIVDFSGVEKFIDTPVKRYSSGMYVRLAFAVAAHLEPEILILDEVLAVGDVDFQKKCLKKIGNIADGGRTVLLVSHTMYTVMNLCNTAILLVNGKIKMQGDAQSVINKYLVKDTKNIVERVWDNEEKELGNELIKVRSARIISESGNRDEVITIETSFRLEFIFSITLSETLFYIGFHFLTLSGERIFVTASTPEITSQGTYKSICFIPGNLLNNGKYTIEVYFVRDGHVVLYKATELLVFEIYDGKRKQGGFLGKLPGAVRPKLKWDVKPVEMIYRNFKLLLL